VLKVNAERLQKNLEDLGKIGADPIGGGVNRFTYSKEYFDGVNLLCKLMTNAGLTVHVDPVGNVIGVQRGKTDRILMMSSHIDTVPHAGIFDGCLGVMAAIETMTILHEKHVVPEHTIMLAAWAEEEGNTVVGLLGSGAFVGKMNHLTTAVVSKMNVHGISCEDIKKAFFSDLPKIDASLELHIEQGGVLDRSGVHIGVVKGIVGIERYLVTILGTMNHAGTTPMSMRDDAMLKAANLIIELDALARETDPDMVCTVGWLNAEPGVANVICGKAVLSVEARSMNLAAVHRIRDYIVARFPESRCTVQTTFRQDPVPMSQICKDAISKAASDLGLSEIELNSGAGHDTMILAEEIQNCGMIFAPSVGGVSHCPQEWTKWTDVENSANVLLGALLNLDACNFTKKQ